MPKGDKIDIEALWRSIPKYASLSESDKTCWRSYLITLEATWKYPEGINALQFFMYFVQYILKVLVHGLFRRLWN